MIVEQTVTPPANRALDLGPAFSAAAELLKSAGSIVLACHVNPDGDALGSMLGLALALQGIGKTVTILSNDGVPDLYVFLPGAHLVRTSSDAEKFDVAVVLDSGDLPRVGSQVLPAIERAERLVNIDHHFLALGFGEIQVVDPRSASTAEIVYDFLPYLGSAMTPEIASCLFVGIVTDTGSFRFQNVTSRTFRVAGELLDAGTPVAAIAEHVFENRTFSATHLLGLALAGLERSSDGRVVWATISAADFLAAGAGDQESEGIVNYVRSVRGADVGIFFREIADASNAVPQVRVSLRGTTAVDVSLIAQKFGGGGHRMAAGCTLDGPLADAKRRMLAAVSEALP